MPSLTARPTKVFLSSTYDDLVAYREHVTQVLQAFETIIVGMEHFGASHQPSLDVCLDHIKRCDLVICLVGTRYGSCPSGSDKSYTEHEIDFAASLGLPIYVYILDDERHPVLRKHIDVGPDATRLQAFKHAISIGRTPSKFTTPENLAMKIAQDLYRNHDLANDPSRRASLVEQPTGLRIPPVPGTSRSTLLNRGYRECSYDLIAEWYDHWYRGHWCSDEPYKNICALASAFFESDRGHLQGRRILDCACGTGNTIFAFIRDGHTAYGTDGSQEMLLRAQLNFESKGLCTDNLIKEPINWTNLDGYLKYFDPESFDIIINTANSFCHIPPVPEYMHVALQNFHRLLKPGGLLIVDTKRYIRSDSRDGVPAYKELRHIASSQEWVERCERSEEHALPGLGTVHFHTRLMYDTDPAFTQAVRRALIVLTVYGDNLQPRTYAIPYYPLPAPVLQAEMRKVEFTATMFLALEGPLMGWKYDVVVGQKDGPTGALRSQRPSLAAS